MMDDVDAIDALVRLGEVTAVQWGLITAEHAAQAGVGAQLLSELTDRGVVVAVADGVFQLAGAPMPANLDIKVAWLQLQPEAPAWKRLNGNAGVVAHSSACRMHGLGDLPTGTVELLVGPAMDHLPAAVGVRLHTGPALDRSEFIVVDGLPVTTVQQTIRDLLAAGQDGGHVGLVVADAMHDGLVHLETLAPAVAPFTSTYGLASTASGQDLIQHVLSAAGRD